MSRARALLGDIATATTTGNLRVAWSNTKARRDVIRNDANEYAAAGKREGLPALEGGATKLKDDLTNLEALGLARPKAATDELPTLQSDHDKLKADFKDTVADSKLLKQVEDLVTANPDGPEAQMRTALGTDNSGNDVFKIRLLAVYKNARFQGSPEINLLTPGEAVAVNTYTANDFEQMNGYLFGRNPLPPPRPPPYPPNDLRMPTEDQIKIKNKQAIDVLAKLPVWTGGMTKRGSKEYPGDDAELALDNVFTIKAF
jgi:hypothetical protein